MEKYIFYENIISKYFILVKLKNHTTILFVDINQHQLSFIYYVIIFNQK